MSADPATLGETAPPEPLAPPLAPPTDPPAPPVDPPVEPEDVPEPTGKLVAPENTTGWYVVLWARKPKKGDQERPRYAEAGFYKGDGDTLKAKKLAMADEANEHLRRSAAQKPGILLRAVPAMNWPVSIEPTVFDRPAPELIIR